jgi:tartrate-resistant acid phosphatase type 5
MQAAKVDVYFNGHDHSLQHLVLTPPHQGPHFVISGAGGYETHPELKMAAAGYLNKQVDTIFRKAAHGFVTAELNSERMLLKFLDLNGAIMYQTEIGAAEF